MSDFRKPHCWFFHEVAYLLTGIHEWKQSQPKGVDVQKNQSFDPIPPVADAISQETWLLCFDEFQVHMLHKSLSTPNISNFNTIVIFCRLN